VYLQVDPVSLRWLYNAPFWHIKKRPWVYVPGAGVVVRSGRWLLTLHLCTWSKFSFAGVTGKGRSGAARKKHDFCCDLHYKGLIVGADLAGNLLYLSIQ